MRARVDARRPWRPLITDRIGRSEQRRSASALVGPALARVGTATFPIEAER